MEKYHGFYQQFYEWLFDKIITDGGLRLQLIASDMGKFFYYRSQLASKEL